MTILRNWYLVFLSVLPLFSSAQTIADTISQNDVSRIIHILAADSLGGRGNYQPGQIKAANFIADEFREANLYPLPALPSFFIPFQPEGNTEPVKDSLEWNGEALSPEQFLYLPVAPGAYEAKPLGAFRVIHIDSFFTEDILTALRHADTDLLLWTDKKQPDGENFLPPVIRVPLGGMSHSVLLVCAPRQPVTLRLAALPVYSRLAWNIVAVLPGRSRANEVVLFSAHYDHMGINPSFRKDSILNGANDDASGTTALITLAKYFAMKKDNERTLMFCAFAGEELGLKGSQDFVRYIDAEKIIANINIEMIGIPQYGKLRVFITGEEYSTLPNIIRKSLPKKSLRVIREPKEEKHLFERSDNFSFVLKGIPAHTIMASDDDDRCYHRPCDEADRINIENMTAIIRAIATASGTLISGEDTPTRVRF